MPKSLTFPSSLSSLSIFRFTPFLIICFWFLLLITSVRNESFTIDEVEHIGSGYFFLKTGEARFNIAHPPLIKIISALPLAFQDYSPALVFPRKSDRTPAVSHAFQLLFDSGNDSWKMLFESRLAVITFNCITALCLWALAMRAFGSVTASLGMVVLLFSPTIVAHARYVTTDVPVMLLTACAMLNFGLLFSRPRRWDILSTSLFITLALLTKYSSLLIIPIMITAVIFLIAKPSSRLSKRAVVLRSLSTLIFSALLVCGFSLWYARKTHLTIPAQLSIAESVREIPAISKTLETVSHVPILNKFGIFLSGSVLQLRRSYLDNSDEVYFAGDRYFGGRVYFFPTLFALKESLVLIFCILLPALLLMFGVIPRSKKCIVPGCLLASFGIAYTLCAMSSNLNIGLRHLLPAYPWFCIGSACSIHRFIKTSQQRAVLLISVITILTFTLSHAWPYYLSYYNPIAGSHPENSWWSVDSDFDWGQDLRRLLKIVDERHIEHLYISYHGRSNPPVFLGKRYVEWACTQGMPPRGSVYAISESLYRYMEYSSKKLSDEKNCDWLLDLTPEWAGSSIRVYTIP